MPYTKPCLVCGTPFTDSHAERKYCSYACNNKSRKSWVKNLCEYCGDEFSTMRSHARRFCSHRCASAGKDRSVEVACPACGKASRRSPSEANHLFCSNVCRGLAAKRREKFKCNRCGKEVETVPKLAKGTRYCSRLCYQKFRGETGPEKKAREALEQLGIPYEAQHPVSLYSIDFYLSEMRVALEVDGLYWHEQPRQKETDKRRDAYLQRRGIVTVRVTDAEIKAAESVAELISSKLHSLHLPSSALTASPK